MKYTMPLLLIAKAVSTQSKKPALYPGTGFAFYYIRLHI